jgi:hypothetical protein
MKVSQPKKHLGESVTLSVIFVGASIGIMMLMLIQSGALQ